MGDTERAADKPAYIYSECVGCGYCCTKAPCMVANRIYGNGVETCPSLQWDGKRYICKLMTLQGELGQQYKKELYAGEGCCSPLNTWRKDICDRTGKPKEKFVLDKEFQAFLKAAGSEWTMTDNRLFFITQGFMHELRKMGYPENEAFEKAQLALHYMTSNKGSFSKDFTG